MKLIFLGPPGAGKGTHADHVTKKYRMPKICIGDIFREEARKGTGLGKELNKYMQKGVLVPDKITIRTLKKRLDEPDCKKGYILDGYPRTLEQAEALEKIADIDLVVNFVLSEKTALQRLGGRVTCRKCDAIYHLQNRPPKKEGVCDKCGGELYIRKDQAHEVIKQRLKTYKEETEPLIDYYRKKGILADFNCEGEVDYVKDRLYELMEERFGK